jgi:Glycosyltransferase like family
MSAQIDFSIIICSHQAHRAIAAREHFEKLFSGSAFEIIMIADAKSLCEGYNRGFHQSSGRLIIFSHDDIEFVDLTLPARLESHLNDFDVIGVAGTTLLTNGAWISAGDPHAFALFAYPDTLEGRVLVKACGRGGVAISGIQALDGCFIAATRAAVEAIGFDAENFDGFHLYDLDFSFRAYLQGLKVAVCRDLLPIHASTGKPDQQWDKYRARFEAKFANDLAPLQNNHARVAQVRLAKTALANFIAEGGPSRLIAAL